MKGDRTVERTHVGRWVKDQQPGTLNTRLSFKKQGAGRRRSVLGRAPGPVLSPSEKEGH